MTQGTDVVAALSSLTNNDAVLESGGHGDADGHWAVAAAEADAVGAITAGMAENNMEPTTPAEALEGYRQAGRLEDAAEADGVELVAYEHQG